MEYTNWKNKIDFVILWVDGNDTSWQKKRNMYMPGKSDDVSVSRYRNWDNLIYWFRSVEKYAPWIRKIHFVSDGQVPEWLNRNHPKLNIVNHKDYIPNEVLPLFNSSSIEIGLHNIKDLSDYFVFFNDDMFLTHAITPEYYFKDGMPCDMAGLTRAVKGDNITSFHSMINNSYRILNKYFDRKKVILNNFFKWFNIFYGKTFFRTLLNLRGNKFQGIVIPHLSVAYRKTDISRVWQVEKDALTKVLTHRFRHPDDINHFVFRFYRFCVGDFYPKKPNGKYFSLSDDKTAKRVADSIKKQRYSEICINDNWLDADYENAKNIINNAFEKHLYQKSSYEI